MLKCKCFGLVQAQGQRLKAHSQNVVLLSIGIKVTKAWENYITLLQTQVLDVALRSTLKEACI